MLENVYGQGEHAVRFDWGPIGAIATAADAVVVVDVFSFSTSVCIACERGMTVYPFRWGDARAKHFAQQKAAVLAVGRLEFGTAGATAAPSLSPAGLLECRPVPRLVLPSPNGSTIAAASATTGATVAAGCLRNATATAEWIAVRLQHGDAVAIIAAGERWSADESLRPALEDHLGAGGIVSALVGMGHAEAMSSEARAAADLFDVCRADLAVRLRNCVGARELAERGFEADVSAAVQIDASPVLPLLVDGAFQAAR